MGPFSHLILTLQINKDQLMPESFQLANDRRVCDSRKHGVPVGAVSERETLLLLSDQKDLVLSPGMHWELEIDDPKNPHLFFAPSESGRNCFGLANMLD